MRINPQPKAATVVPAQSLLKEFPVYANLGVLEAFDFLDVKIRKYIELKSEIDE